MKVGYGSPAKCMINKLLDLLNVDGGCLQDLLIKIFAVGCIITVYAAAENSWTIASTEITQRFSRTILQTTPGIIPTYLVPTIDEPICAGQSCCNSDYTASPYRLQNLNSTLQYAGQQIMTTFYMSLYSNTDLCSSYAGNNTCCTSDVTKLWVDIDPNLSVQYMSYGGQTANFIATQDEFGMQLQLPQQQALSISPQGTLITVTVAGNASSLCAPPDYMLGLSSGTPPICQVIMAGSTPSKAGACCPFNLAAPINTAVSYVPPLPQCSAAISSSPFAMQLKSVSYPSSPVIPANTPLATNYTFTVTSSAPCNASAINQCCSMVAGSVKITLASSAVILSTTVNGAPNLNTAQAALNSINSGLMTFTINGLNLVQGESMEITLLVALKPGSSAVPDICQPGQPESSTVGACSYTFLPAANSVGGSMCCPSSTTSSTTPGNNSATICSPSTEVAISQTIMRFSYIEGPVAVSATPSSPASTRFTFMVYNNYTVCTSLMYCESVCNWQLFINPSIISTLTFDSDLALGASGMQSISIGSNSSVTFTAPPYMETVSYTIIVPQADITLDNLCNNHALGTQSGSPCAAVLRNPSVFSVVLFSEFDVVIPPTSPTPSPYPAVSICSSGNGLSGSCVRVLNATYNTPSSSTVFDFNVMNYGKSSTAPGGCTPDEAVMSLQVLLQPTAASQLQSSNAVVPSSVQFGSDNGVLATVTWTWTPTDGASMHYQMDLSGSLKPDEVCMQRAVPDQPDDSCVVAFTGATTCYTGFIPVYFDSSLQPIPTTSSSVPSGPKASFIAPAVVVPIIVLAAVAVAGFLYWRRRNHQSSESLLGEPLAAARISSSFGGTPPHGSRQDSGAIFERAPSDVFIRLPSSAH
ncbi:hypothetical protein CEUSTIGMA_g4371.t1 [Chlamydomonas eustigma]|uniref:Pherophorin domain-containing protein n=1 Tax=Chlamydomonas eustigma TaxID=1157962 RepID=A0A250X1F0_9CHLO|nr:hypothetical protein CEUSTIGMA_g4371.t1 [Chlamydomonas eustigma]|eukprot:GAX76924.1 hypothetical protein CEUSTIGMA_g4371.t1 [Chlamydomonas eustigma]